MDIFKRLSLLIVLLLATVLMGFSQAGKIEFTEFKLDNGLHVILHKDTKTPIVVVSVMYDVGSKHEKPDRTGFAHFFEHLMFEGTKNIARGEYSKIVERAGGALNANTAFDRTYYYELLPSNQLELGLWLESERMLHATVDSVGIQTQKHVVIEEKKQVIDNQPYGTLFTELLKRAFTIHPYRWFVIGEAEHIMAALDEEFQAFYDTFYVPDNAVLVIAGDIDINRTKQLVSKYFSEIPKGKQNYVYEKIIEPPLKGEIRDTVFDNVQLPLILQAYRSPEMNSDDFYAMSMLSTLLSGGESSRLYRELVDNKQLALQVNSIPLPFKEPSLSVMLALPNMGIDPDVLEKAVDAEVEKVKKELIPEREFQKLRNQFENQVISENQRMATIAHNLATNHTYFGDASLINKELERYMAVTREDIQRVANKYFRTENRVVLYYMPKKTN
jgi:predicted Zn-dependent peptidase